MIHRIHLDCSDIGVEYAVDDLNIVNLSYGSMYILYCWICGAIVGLLEVVKHIFVYCPIQIEYFTVMCLSASIWKWFFICCDNGLNCCLSQHNNHLSSWLLQVLIWMVFSEGSLAQLLGTPILLQTRTWLWIGERTRCTITCLTQRRCVWLMVSFNFIACDNSKIKEDLLYTHHTWSYCLIMAARWSCV
jgi:hypothetical protein